MKGNFNKIINGDKPVLVDFHATWCGPCKAQTPILKELAKEVSGKLRIIKIDVDKNQALANQYQVMGVPTLALFQDGQVVWKESGMKTKQQLLNILNENL